MSHRKASNSSTMSHFWSSKEMFNRFIRLGFSQEELVTIEGKSKIKFHPRLFEALKEQFDRLISEGKVFQDCSASIFFKEPFVILKSNHGRGYACVHYLLTRVASKLKRDQKKKIEGKLENLDEEVKKIVPNNFFSQGGKIRTYYDKKLSTFGIVILFWKKSKTREIKISMHKRSDLLHQLEQIIPLFFN